MKNILTLSLFLILWSSVVRADGWVACGEIRPTQPVVQYVNMPPSVFLIAVPIPQVYYVPVTTYQNIIIEKNYWCLSKRYEVVPVPQTVYVPYRY